jgi:hypothetical protein
MIITFMNIRIAMLKSYLNENNTRIEIREPEKFTCNYFKIGCKISYPISYLLIWYW